jgi:hypothetical protein
VLNRSIVSLSNIAQNSMTDTRFSCPSLDFLASRGETVVTLDKLSDFSWWNRWGVRELEAGTRWAV